MDIVAVALICIGVMLASGLITWYAAIFGLKCDCPEPSQTEMLETKETIPQPV